MITMQNCKYDVFSKEFLIVLAIHLVIELVSQSVAAWDCVLVPGTDFVLVSNLAAR